MQILSEKIRYIINSVNIPLKFTDKPTEKYDNNEMIVTFEPETGVEEIERYWVDEPYAFVSILKNDNDLYYHVVEPELNEVERSLLDEVLFTIGDVLTLKDVNDLDEIDKQNKYIILKEKINELLSDNSQFSEIIFEKIYYYIKRDFIDFGNIGPVMCDPNIEDAWCNGVGIPVYIFHSTYGNLITNITFENDDQIAAFVMRVAHQSSRHISRSSPILDTVMQDGSRINITYGHEISPKGSSFSIRKQKRSPLTPLDLIDGNTFSSDIMAYFWLCMEHGKNILICGGTASGKTSTMNAVCMFIPLNIRIVTLEDTREIQLPHENWIPMITREGISNDSIGNIDLDDLLRASLRQRPDYLLVGEVRGRESQILFQAMNAGHATCSTFHAGSPTEVINRFTNPPINVPTAMFTALDVICMQSNTFENGTEIRKVSKITEVTGVSEKIDTQDVFIWNKLKDIFEYNGSKILNDIRVRRGWSEEDLKNALNERKYFLETLISKGIRDHSEVIYWIEHFNRSPEKSMIDLDIQ
ncbi:type II/IV secretion system ATPase subunit [Methanolobus profundi]|uniref:Flagellar protein FlaI n=1 Tax=Methanolobus profundi TaxID=487685 RepID=A0A1I4PG03_9EURY|nr:type II/IV secretion system ATPase subunit [Methanolobus profundi]SFM26343.1 flagellar protein FlaI [Methanolobus profundi]